MSCCTEENNRTAEMEEVYNQFERVMDWVTTAQSVLGEYGFPSRLDMKEACVAIDIAISKLSGIKETIMGVEKLPSSSKPDTSPPSPWSGTKPLRVTEPVSPPPVKEWDPEVLKGVLQSLGVTEPFSDKIMQLRNILELDDYGKRSMLNMRKGE